MLSALIIFLNFIINLFSYTLLLILICFVALKIWIDPFTKRCKCKTKLNEKVALITGGNSGIGFETAKALAERGARVIIASRNEKKSAQAVDIIKQETGNDKVEYRHLNLLKLDSVQEFAEKFNEDFDRLDILVNNAACGEIKKGYTENGIDLLMQINYIGPFLLTHLLLDKLIKSKPSRIVMVSSFLHYLGRVDPEKIASWEPIYTYLPGARYGKTKLCIILWAKELAKRVPQGVTVNVLHPGLVMTNIFDKLNYVTKYIIHFAIYLLFISAEEGAQTIIHLCVSPNLESSTGDYYQNCKRVKASKTAEDADLARRLWEKSVAIIDKYSKFGTLLGTQGK
ncbi:retinol dehydrogenase 13-like [Bicyclus anynana]|uniref:Retinol dehydrogenase 13-like n=1 Tax=Bicyclus anynana TaxID=110368 RepID=A0A6J1NC52_BICAN|nr:retinol dehydrogenase 13-like [Bicyclus anynana]